MATINFLYRSTKKNAPLTLRLLFRDNESNDFRFDVKTKYQIEKNYWDNKHFKNSKNAEIKNKKIQVNSDLLEIENFVLNAFNDLENKTYASKNWLKKQIELYYNPNEGKQSELVTDAIQKIINEAHVRDNGKGSIGLTQCRINGYKRLKTLFIDFQDNNQYKVKELDKNKFDNFKKWLLNENGYSASYSLKKLSDLKTVCKDARSNGIETSSELNDIKTKQVSAYDDDMNVIILTPQELKQIENTTLKSEALVNARKWLILACYTGQRGQALTTRIKKENFEKYGADLVIKIRQKKGNKSVIIPVLPKVKEIYENGLPYTISMQKLNKHFKEIGKLAKLNEPVMGRIIEAEIKGKKRGVKKLRPKYKYLSTHIGRRTFASNHYGKIPTPIIMRVTGHSKESTFLGYINQTDDSHIDTCLKLYRTKELKERKEPELNVIKNASRQ